MKKRGAILLVLVVSLLFLLLLTCYVLADGSLITVKLMTPADGNISEIGGNLALKFNVTSNKVGGQLYVNCSLWANNTGTFMEIYLRPEILPTNSTLTSFANLTVTLTELGSIIWNVRCVNTQNNSNFAFAGSNNTLIVIDKTAPTLTLDSPTPGQNISSAIVDLYCTATDPFLKNVSLMTSVSSWHINQTNDTGTSGEYHFSQDFVSGTYKWNCYSCDQSGNCAFAASNRTFIVDLSYPSFRGKGHNVSQAIGLTRYFKVTANITDNVKIKNVTIRYSTNSELAMSLAEGNYTRSTTASELGITTSSTNHILIIRACDYSGNCNTTTMSGINIDNSVPKVTQFRSNVSYVKSSWRIMFNATVNDTSLQTVYLNYTNRARMKNTSLYKWYIINSTAQLGCSNIEGTCRLNIVANDAVSNVNNTAILTIRVDDLKPRVYSINANDTDNYVKPAQVVLIVVNATDANMSTVTINDSSLTHFGSIYWIANNLTSLGCVANRKCNLSAVATDSLGNTNNTVRKVLYLDASSPGIAIHKPLNWTNTSSRLVNLTIIDNLGIANASISVSGVSSYSVKNCSHNTNWTKAICTFMGTGLGQGLNTINVSLKDKADNAASKITTFRYDTAGPTITASLSPNTTSTTPSRNMTLVYSVTDSVTSVSSAWFRLDGKATQYALSKELTSTVLTQRANFTAGAHSLVIYAVDSANNSASLDVGSFYIRAQVNLSNYTQTQKRGDVKNVTIYLADGSVATGYVYFNQTVRQVIIPNASRATVNVSINITVYGNNIVISNSHKPRLDANRTGLQADKVKNKLGGAPFAAFILYQNMSSLIPGNNYTDSSGVAQWVQIMLRKSLGNNFVIFVADDVGSNIYVLDSCANKTRPSPPATLAGACYTNGTNWVRVFVPHLSGVGLTNPNYAPSYSITSPGSTVANSMVTASGMIYDLNLNTSSCWYNLSKGATTVARAAVTPTLSQGSTNYSFSLSYTSITEFRNLTNHTKYNITISCASLGNGNRSKNRTQFLVNDITWPSVSSSVSVGTTSATITLTGNYEPFNYTISYVKASSGTAAKVSDSGFSTSFSTTISSLSSSTTYNYTYTVCDRAKNCNSTLKQFTTQSQPAQQQTPASSGGGIGLKSLTTTTRTWDILRAGQNSFTIATGDYGIKKLSFSTKETARKVTITIQRYTAKPTDVPETEGTVYKYLLITLTNLKDDNVNNLKIEFKVSKDWLTTNKVSEADIVLKRLVSNAWVDLPTTMTATDAKEVTFEVESAGFSYFAIAAKSVSQPAVAPKEEKVEQKPAEKLNATIPTGQAVAAKPAVPAQQPPKLEPKKTVTWLIVTIVIVSLALFVLSYMFFRGRTSKLEKEALRYIHRSREVGRTDNRIAEDLREAGWPEKKIQKLIKRKHKI